MSLQELRSAAQLLFSKQSAVCINCFHAWFVLHKVNERAEKGGNPKTPNSLFHLWSSETLIVANQMSAEYMREQFVSLLILQC